MDRILSSSVTEELEYEHHLVAYSPLVRGNVFDAPEIRNVAEKRDISGVQDSLTWLLPKGNARASPKAPSEDHIRDNFGAP